MKLEELCERLHRLMAEEQKIEHDEVVSEPQAPASDDEIADWQSELERELPADYVAFLKLHNGWWGFGANVYDLLPANGEGATHSRSEGESSLEMGGEFNPWLDEHGNDAVVLGVGHRCQVVWDSGTGEILEFYLFEEEGRHDSFTAFLRAYLEGYESLRE